MERLRQRLDTAFKALQTLEEVIGIQNPSSIERDATIQRFEYTFEVVWKAAKEFLRDKEGIDAASPKGVIRKCREVGLLDEAETIQALEMADDRNLTSHTYNDRLAQEIYLRIRRHYPLMKKWLEQMMEKA
ncbi:nucleotidyltransferase [Caldalkalibacillus thermarum]|uniref:HI0074 family nucleotidyltransferase substrate-binding subunit n=1 Tax=Caldalkalibacillus thermarum TaxID=296745 RepID=UPI001665E504|nr:HI0074 family nucleotidyltransferase substrate-binding subunit [Caldalkalibacillus thermarum]GGK24165.1 nucleotidyltransferase [Caldalkalibacillus thermarum]